MNDLLNVSSEMTMTSREIADLVELRHDNVKRTIEKMDFDKIISHPQFEDGIKSANGVTEKVYIICKRDTYIIVSQLSSSFIGSLFDRWIELEAQQNSPKTTSEALRLAADLAEKNEEYDRKRKAFFNRKFDDCLRLSGGF